MHSVDTVIIGAGQAGLAMSRCLTDRARDHVVLERGRLAERWRSERWDSMRLLSPNWMTRLPGWSYTGSEPDGFMTAAEVVTYFERYGTASAAPVEEHTSVVSLAPDGAAFRVATDGGTWSAANVVIATGWCDRPARPSLARSLSPAVDQIAPSNYRNPSSVPDGGVLIVGGSATGVQLAAELSADGRDVVLAVGRHTRLPRSYRGMDILWWLERMGNFDHTIDQVPDPVRARHQPSLQLAGGSDGRSLDLRILQDTGVRIAGRVTGIDGTRVALASDLAATTARADERLRRILGDIDDHITANGLGAEVLDPDPPPLFGPVTAPEGLDLARTRIRTVIWATGHRRAYPWLQVPVLDASGEITQLRGVTSWPGLYVLGQRFQHFRNSDFIDGVGRDAAIVADHLVQRTSRRAAPRCSEIS
jgi:putative flavoprotein involved in K+ transport